MLAGDWRFLWRAAEREVILCAARWRIRYWLLSREVEALLTEGGLEADHATMCGSAIRDIEAAGRLRRLGRRRPAFENSWQRIEHGFIPIVEGTVYENMIAWISHAVAAGLRQAGHE